MKLVSTGTTTGVVSPADEIDIYTNPVDIPLDGIWAIGGTDYTNTTLSGQSIQVSAEFKTLDGTGNLTFTIKRGKTKTATFALPQFNAVEAGLSPVPIVNAKLHWISPLILVEENGGFDTLEIQVQSDNAADTEIGIDIRVYNLDPTDSFGRVNVGTWLDTVVSLANGYPDTNAIQVASGTPQSDIATETAQAQHQAINTLIKAVITPDSVFTIDAGSLEDDAYNNMVVSVIDKSTGDVISRRVTDYVGSTRQITVDYDFEFALEDGVGNEDTVIIWADTYSTTAGAAAASEIADAVWNEKQAEHIANGSMGQRQAHSGRGRY